MPLITFIAENTMDCCCGQTMWKYPIQIYLFLRRANHVLFWFLAGFFVALYPFPVLAMSIMGAVILYAVWRSRPPFVVQIAACLTVLNFLTDLMYFLTEQFHRVVIALMLLTIVLYTAAVFSTIRKLRHDTLPPRLFTNTKIKGAYFLAGVFRTRSYVHCLSFGADRFCLRYSACA